MSNCQKIFKLRYIRRGVSPQISEITAAKEADFSEGVCRKGRGRVTVNVKSKVALKRIVQESPERDGSHKEQREVLDELVQRLFGDPVPQQPIVDLELGIYQLPD